MQTNVKGYSDTQLLDQVTNALGFSGFPNGVLDIWVRSAEDAFNTFDDKAYTYECYGDNKEPKFISVTSGTTNAGAFGLKKFHTYNRRGCAVLKANTIVVNSHYFGYHKNRPSHPAYRQNKPYPYHRDNNRNNKAEELGKVYWDIIGANCHRAGWISKYINNWSTACLVRNVRSDYNDWLNYMDRRLLSVSILNEF